MRTVQYLLGLLTCAASRYGPFDLLGRHAGKLAPMHGLFFFVRVTPHDKVWPAAMDVLVEPGGAWALRH